MQRGETRRLAVQVKKVGGGRAQEPGTGRERGSSQRCRAGAVASERAEQVRGAGSTQRWRGRKRPRRRTTTPGGAQRDPRPGPSQARRAPNSVSSPGAQVRPGGGGAGRGGAARGLGSTPHPPLAATRVAGATAAVQPAPTREGSSPPPSASAEPAGPECGVPGGSGPRARLSRLLPAWPGRRAGGGRPGG